MGAGSSSTFPPIDESSLLTTATINSCSLFVVKTCFCKLASFKETTLIHYAKSQSIPLPEKLITSPTYKAILNAEFTYEKLVERALQAKHLSHPSVVRVSSFIVPTNRSALYLITEPTLPLRGLLDGITKDEVLVGLHSVLQAIDFLHSRAYISHNNIDVSCLFVNSRKKWKIGLFEFACKLDDLSQNRLEVLESLKNRAEDREAVKIVDCAKHAYDIYCFSRMVIEILSRLDFGMSEFQTVLKRSGLHSSPEQRPSASQLLKHATFKTPYAYIVSFLSDYVLKSDPERIRFFEKLPELARQIPAEVFCSSILPLILVPSIFTDYPAKSLARHVLTPFQEGTMIGLVPVDAFPRLVVPHISRLFRYHEINTRLILLQHFQAYARLMGSELLKTVVLPEVCMGVYDANESLAVASLSGLAHLAHLLGVTCTMSHFQSLGAQMESRGFLTTSSDTRSSTTYHLLSLEHSKKPLNYCSTRRPWRHSRATFYPDAAPKINRQARETPVKTRSGAGDRLCDMAVLSAKYVPISAPTKISGVPYPLVKKLSSSTPVQLAPQKSPSPNPYTKTSGDEDGSIPTNDVVLESSASLVSFDASPAATTNAILPPPDLPSGYDADEHCADWTWDAEDDKFAVKASPSLVTSPTLFSSEKSELRERAAQVNALLAELEPKITKNPTATSSSHNLSERDNPPTTYSLSSSGASLRYKSDNLLNDLDDGNEGGDGWNFEDDVL